MRFVAVCWLVGAFWWTLTITQADEPARRHEVVTPKDDGINITGINTRGDLVGFEWRDDPANPGVVGQDPFFARGKVQTFLPLLPTYTATFPAAVSDDGLVVGRAGKPSSPRGRVKLQNQAFTWTEADGIQGIGTLPDDWASFATGVSRDGTRIIGISVGDNRLRPCLWERTSGTPQPLWQASPLPVTGQICSNFLAISGDGRKVAGVDNGTPSLWTRGDDTTWTREPLGAPGSISPRAVNDSGVVAGIISPPDGSTHAVVWTRASGVKPIPEPAGYARSEASAINNSGSIVGMIDGPHGSDIAPKGFVFENSQLRILEEAGPNLAGATVINDAGQFSGVFEKEEEPVKNEGGEGAIKDKNATKPEN